MNRKTVIDNLHPSNILLLGNGLSRALGGKSTDDLFQKHWLNQDIAFDSAEIKTEPFPIRIIIGTNDSVDKACEGIGEFYLDKEFYQKKDYQLIRIFLSLNVSDILTTNYSYEFEYALDPGFLSHKEKNAGFFAGENLKRREAKFFLHSYYQFDDSKRIWHIHGEAKNKTSIVLGQYYYGKLLSRYINYLDTSPNFRKTISAPFNQRSWLDSFIYGNVFIIGLRLAFSETDLWWLLNRKKLQENQRGKVTLFLNKKDQITKAEEQMFRLFNVEIIRDNSSRSASDNDYFSQYYSDVYETIKETIGDSNGNHQM